MMTPIATLIVQRRKDGSEMASMTIAEHLSDEDQYQLTLWWPTVDPTLPPTKSYIRLTCPPYQDPQTL